MKLLESAPWRYDRGINLLTLGIDTKIKRRIVEDFIRETDRVLDIGCGTGTLALMLARKGASVTAFDVSPIMVALAQQKLVAERLRKNIQFLEMDITEMDRFSDESFDVVVSTLVLSELSEVEQAYVFNQVRRILRPGGRFIVVDEVRPMSARKMLMYYTLRVPLAILTYLAAHTTTHRVANPDSKVKQAGFRIIEHTHYLIDSLVLLVSEKEEQPLPVTTTPLLAPTVKVGSRIRLVAETLLRWFRFPTSPGLIVVGHPDQDSPVLVTCNFDLTIRRLLKSLRKGKVDCYVIVAPTRGINVWCAACGNDFTAHSVIAAIKLSGIADLVRHRNLILPQLSAPGVDPSVIKEKTGWSARFGPTYAKDLPAYLSGNYQKTARMRMVRFPLSSRLEMASIYAVTISLILGPLSLLLAPAWILGVLVTIWLITCGAYSFLPYLPGKSGFVKGLVYGIVTVGAVLCFAFYTTGSILGLPVILLAAIVISLILGVDLNGTTPTFPSDMGQLFYKRGHKEMAFFTGVYPLQPYGKITLDIERCIGCGTCIEVCPRNVYDFDKVKHKAILARPEHCVNCNACVNRCPQQCLQLVSP